MDGDATGDDRCQRSRVSLVTNGETGLVVPKADPSALADALRSLYRDATLRRDLARRGRQHVETHLSAVAIVPRLEDVYTEVLAQ